MDDCIECTAPAHHECTRCNVKLCRNPECIALHLKREHPAKQLAFWGR